MTTDPAAAPVLADIAPVADFTTRDGLVLAVRPAYAEDAETLDRFFDQVSEEDRRFRFLSAVRHVGPDQIDALTHVDHWRTESWLAFDKAGGALVASVMLACDAKMDTGEVAIALHRAYRGRGAGWTLLDMVANAARARGLRRVIAIEDRDNHAAIELEREKGFVAHGVDGDAHRVLLEKRFD